MELEEIFDSNEADLTLRIMDNKDRHLTNPGRRYYTDDNQESTKSLTTSTTPLRHAKSFPLRGKEDTVFGDNSIDQMLEAPLNRTISQPQVHFEDFIGTPEKSYQLPIMSTDPAFARVDSSAILTLMQSSDRLMFQEKYLLVDCRYPFEYQGGHIKGAVNIFDPADCEALFYSPEGPRHPRIPIFYCEFSQKRGPAMARTLRKIDRRRNEACYLHLDYPEIYVLNLGYNGFYSTIQQSIEHQDLFSPTCSYTRMDDEKYKDELSKYSFHRKRAEALKHASRLRSRRPLWPRDPNVNCEGGRVPSSVKEDSNMQTTPVKSRPLPSKLIFS